MVKIGITNTASRYENYVNWIAELGIEVQIIKLCADEGNWDMIEECDGILLSGGIDSHPSFYNNERENYPNAPDAFDIARDEFEMHVFETAVNFNIPILAICRGLQIVNISLGGTLIQDLEESGKNDHRRHGDIDSIHSITLTEPSSLLATICNTDKGIINSAHHQAIDTLSDELLATAYSEDGVVEAAEWKSKTDKNWLLCVQWHPERMTDRNDNPFSANIRNAFFEAVKLYHKYNS